MASITTARSTIGTVLGTVETTALTFTRALDAANTSVGMLNTYVERAADTQRKRYALESEALDQKLMDDAALLEMNRRTEIDRQIGSDPRKLELYNNALKRYRKVLGVTEPEVLPAA